MLQQSDSVDITTKIPATAAVSHSSRLTFCNHFFFFAGEVILIASFFNLKGTDRDSKINLAVEILNVTVPAITHRWKQSAYIHSVQSTKLNFIYIALYTHTPCQTTFLITATRPYVVHILQAQERVNPTILIQMTRLVSWLTAPAPSLVRWECFHMLHAAAPPHKPSY